MTSQGDELALQGRSGVLRLLPDRPPSLRQRVLAPVAWATEHLLGLRALERVYHTVPEQLAPAAFLGSLLEQLQVRVEVPAADLAAVPATGAAMVVANHPFGGIEGLVLAHLMLTRRPDVKVLVNSILGKIPELRPLFLPVDPFGGSDATMRSVAGLRRAARWLRDGGLLVVFPAGEVAHLDLRRRCVLDPPWHASVARLVRRHGCTVIPAYIAGSNGALFHLAGMVHAMLRTLLLPRALLDRRGDTLQLCLGSPIPPGKVAQLPDDGRLTSYLRGRTEVLAERLTPVSPERRHAGPVQPRRTPSVVHPVVPAEAPEQLAAEVDQLPPAQLLVDGGKQAVYVARAEQIPSVLREIGRLRELTFRAAGEGTGREIDLDRFDETYEHLFIWGREQQEVVGAYRIGRSDQLLAAEGLAGLYTSTLFRYDRRLLEAMGPSLELGRSFLRVEHQRSFTGLLLLWKGIGRYVLALPSHPTLFGPVSISADYHSASQQLLVTFLQQNRWVHEWSRWVQPLCPFRPRRHHPGLPTALELEDLDEVSSFIAEIEQDRKGMPVLLRQYLKLGGRLLGFNVDPEFADVLDVLLLVDLRLTDPTILARYMGKEGAASFLAQHAGSRLH